MNLDRLYKMITRAQTRLGEVPCLKCGNCCRMTTVRCSAVEAAQAARWVAGQLPAERQKILDACGEWLTRRDPHLKVWGLPASMTPDEKDQVEMEMIYLTMEGPCPLLKDNLCMVYPARPVACRLFGLTRKPIQACARHDGGYVEDYDDLKRAVGELDPGDFGDRVLFLPTLLFLKLKPESFLNHLTRGEIPAAKLLPQANNTLLWQDQIDELADTAELSGSISSPVPAAERSGA